MKIYDIPLTWELGVIVCSKSFSIVRTKIVKRTIFAPMSLSCTQISGYLACDNAGTPTPAANIIRTAGAATSSCESNVKERI